jgi:CBS domain-containing protein
MSPVPITVAASDSIGEAAARMAKHGLHRVPVLGADGKLNGMLSAIDVMRWLAHSDGFSLPGDTHPPRH